MNFYIANFHELMVVTIAPYLDSAISYFNSYSKQTAERVNIQVKFKCVQVFAEITCLVECIAGVMQYMSETNVIKVANTGPSRSSLHLSTTT